MITASGFSAGGDLESAGTIVRENPSRHVEMVGELSLSSIEATRAAVAAASAAQCSWATVTMGERIVALRQAADAVGTSAGDLAPILAAELGKPLADCEGEMGFAAAFTRDVCDRAPTVLAEQSIDDDAGRLVVERRPYGVCAAIVPWNAPLILSSLKVAPALVAGNAIVVKPSPLAPFAVTEALRRMSECLPPGLLSVVHGEADVGRELVNHADVAKVAFTGGTEVGRSVLADTARRVVPSIMELGGNDAAVLLDDAPLTPETAERLVFGAFLTGGQVCMAIKRLYVPRRHFDTVVTLLREAAGASLVCGDPMAADVTVGPLVSSAHRDRVAAMVEGAGQRGATVVEVGQRGEGFDPDAGHFLAPTLVVDIPAHDELVVEEQFGPTLPIVPYDSEDQVLTWVNESPYGLGSSVWSAREDRAFDVARHIEAGMTFVNCHNRAGMSLRAPFGGIKQSGFGREFGDAGIAEYGYLHSIHLPGSMRASGDGAGGREYPS